MADNFSVRVVSRGRDHLDTAVRLAWGNTPGGKATHYVSSLPERKCPNCRGGVKTAWNGKEHIEYRCVNCNGTDKIPPCEVLILLWHEDLVRGVKATPLPFPLTCEAAIDFLWAWLATAKYPKEPDHDGDNSKGFIVSTGDFWGHVEGSHYAFLAVYPDWQMYGK